LDYLFEPVKENVYVFSIWDSSWNSFNNCYVILQEEGVVLIDCGKKDHSTYLVQVLKEIGKGPEDVSLILATHGHEDHVQGATIFPNAQKYIHSNERSHMEYSEPDQFNYLSSTSGMIQDFDYFLVGHHTTGSVAYHHHSSNILFTGDFLCFFGDPLSKAGLVSEGMELREAWLEYLRDGGIPQAEWYGFQEGLKAIHLIDADALCTGHGGVLVGNIKQFISELLQEGDNLSKEQPTT
jgi:glyoxylase-like metal-dependent hydrolase (beta-lactamase superfamily II)